MFCSNCGKELTTSDNFCPNCGKKLEVLSPAEILAQVAAEQQLATGNLLFIDPETQAKSYVQMTEEKAKAINAESKDDEYYKNLIENWEINAQLKSCCEKLISMTVKIGNTVFRIGKWVLNLVVDILHKIRDKFPNTIMGAIIGFAFGLVFSMIPLLGWLLGGVVTPLFTIAGGILGLMADMSNTQLAKKVAAEVFRAQGLASV